MPNALGSPSGHGSTERGLIEAAVKTAAPLSPKTGSPPKFDGRFGRMFPGLRGAAFFDADLTSLAEAMSADDEAEATPETEVDSEENLGLPAGYTYFGQFVDHDISLDAVSLSMKQEDLNLTENFRTPALDLDSLYGRGPEDQPYMYGVDGTFVMNARSLLAGPGGDALTKDLPRLNGRAIIGDKRNDENVIVSQLHGLFLRLHNYFIIDKKMGFGQARQMVQWHYQWLVLFDYLPRIVGADLVKSILPHTATGASIAVVKPSLKIYSWDKFPFMPVEFAGAAYRFGHSMVRPIYRLNLNDAVGKVEPQPGQEAQPGGRLKVFQPSINGEALNGFREFPDTLGIDWDLFFETKGRLLKDHFLNKDRIQPAYKIDTSLVFPLKRLPEFSDNAGNPNAPGAVNALALRNLKRGMMLLLPSGQSVAQYLIDHGVAGVRVLKDDELLVGKADAENFDAGVPIFSPAKIEGGVKKDAVRTSMQDSAPLWFYMLAEARFEWKQAATQALLAAGNPTEAQREALINGTPTRLGPVGGRIVAETLIGLVLGDETSFLNSPTPFVPIFGNAAETEITKRFQMGDLLKTLVV